MPIKKLTFQFEVPITQLLGLIATGNTGLKIDVIGDDRPHHPKLLNGAHPVKLLEGPRRGKGSGSPGLPRQRGKDSDGKPMTAYNAILAALAASANHTGESSDLIKVVTALGLSKNSATSQVSLLRTHGFVRQIGRGLYELTKSGVAECDKRGLKEKPKRKSKAPAPAAPVAAEPDHG